MYLYYISRTFEYTYVYSFIFKIHSIAHILTCNSCVYVHEYIHTYISRESRLYNISEGFVRRRKEKTKNQSVHMSAYTRRREESYLLETFNRIREDRYSLGVGADSLARELVPAAHKSPARRSPQTRALYVPDNDDRTGTNYHY